jgi:hypothetical protein
MNDPATLGKLSQVSLIARDNAGNVNSSIEPDGSFYFCGLRPGRIKISAHSFRQPGFWLLRVERDGLDLSGGIEVSPGVRLTGVRVVLAHMTGVIRGQVTIEGYELPRGVRLQISARRLSDEVTSGHLFAETDDRGRFAIEGLASGEYELSAGEAIVSDSGARRPRLSHVRQKVTVTNEKESAVTLVLKVIER